VWIEFLANIGNFRTSYQSDKHLAKVGEQVEKLQRVQSKLMLIVGSKEVLGDGSVEAFNGRDDILMRCFEVVRK
jgi:hypothetical protein